MLCTSACPIIGVIISMPSSRCLTIKDVAFRNADFSVTKAEVFYVDAEPPLFGGEYPVRKGSREFFDLEAELNKVLSPELYFSIIKIERDVILLECIV